MRNVIFFLYHIKTPKPNMSQNYKKIPTVKLSCDQMELYFAGFEDFKQLYFHSEQYFSDKVFITPHRSVI